MIKDFIKKYKEYKSWVKPVTDQEILDRMSYDRPSFELHCFVPPLGISIGSSYTQTLIKLDEEDIEILYKKYSAKLKEELEAELNKVRKEYWEYGEE